MNARRRLAWSRASWGKLSAGLISLALSMLPMSAGAAPGDEVAELMATAQELYVAGRYAEAEQKAEAAWAKKRTVDIATSLGQMEHKQGKFAEAAEHLDYARKNLNVNESDEVRNRIEALFEEARRQSGAFVVQTNVTGAVMRVSGREGTFPVSKDPTFVTPGKLSVTVSKDGYKDATITTRSEVGETKILSVNLESLAGSVDAPPDEGRPLWPTIVLGIAGAAGVGTAIGLTVASLGKASDAEDLGASALCASPRSQDCLDKGQELKDEQGALESGSIAAYSIGGAALVGMILYLAIPESKSAGSTGFAPSFVPHAGGGNFSWTF